MRFIPIFILSSLALEVNAQLYSRDDLKRGNTILLENVNFFSEKTDLLPSSKTELDTLSQYLLDYPMLAIELVGHTDIEGDKKENKKISEKRAEEVKSYLISRGVEAERLNAIGKGGSRPIIDKSSPFNQRMEFVVISNPGVKKSRSAKKVLKNTGSDTSNQKRVALIIGNSNYSNSPVLKNPINDANTMASTLDHLGFEVEKILDASYASLL